MKPSTYQGVRGKDAMVHGGGRAGAKENVKQCRWMQSLVGVRKPLSCTTTSRGDRLSQAFTGSLPASFSAAHTLSFEIEGCPAESGEAGRGRQHSAFHLSAHKKILRFSDRFDASIRMCIRVVVPGKHGSEWLSPFSFLAASGCATGPARKAGTRSAKTSSARCRME